VTKEGCGWPYGFGEVRVATLALLIFTALSGWRSCGVVRAQQRERMRRIGVLSVWFNRSLR
jgi:hypothetical protein